MLNKLEKHFLPKLAKLHPTCEELYFPIVILGAIRKSFKPFYGLYMSILHLEVLPPGTLRRFYILQGVNAAVSCLLFFMLPDLCLIDKINNRLHFQFLEKLLQLVVSAIGTNIFYALIESLLPLFFNATLDVVPSEIETSWEQIGEIIENARSARMHIPAQQQLNAALRRRGYLATTQLVADVVALGYMDLLEPQPALLNQFLIARALQRQVYIGVDMMGNIDYRLNEAGQQRQLPGVRQRSTGRPGALS